MSHGVRILAAQTGGVDFDLGNSPREFTPDKVRGRTIASTTTNGTRALRACAQAWVRSRSRVPASGPWTYCCSFACAAAFTSGAAQTGNVNVTYNATDSITISVSVSRLKLR